MAKTKPKQTTAVTRFIGAAGQVVAPEPKRPAVRRVASLAVRAAINEKHTLTAVAAAGALGLAERNGIPIPHLALLGQAGTLGAVAWIAGKMTGNETAKHVATGLLSIAAYELAKGGGGGGGKVAGDNETAGDEVISGDL